MSSVQDKIRSLQRTTVPDPGSAATGAVAKAARSFSRDDAAPAAPTDPLSTSAPSLASRAAAFEADARAKLEDQRAALAARKAVFELDSDGKGTDTSPEIPAFRSHRERISPVRAKEQEKVISPSETSQAIVETKTHGDKIPPVRAKEQSKVRPLETAPAISESKGHSEMILPVRAKFERKSSTPLTDPTSDVAEFKPHSERVSLTRMSEAKAAEFKSRLNHDAQDLQKPAEVRSRFEQDALDLPRPAGFKSRFEQDASDLPKPGGFKSRIAQNAPGSQGSSGFKSRLERDAPPSLSSTSAPAPKPAPSPTLASASKLAFKSPELTALPIKRNESYPSPPLLSPGPSPGLSTMSGTRAPQVPPSDFSMCSPAVNRCRTSNEELTRASEMKPEAERPSSFMMRSSVFEHADCSYIGPAVVPSSTTMAVTPANVSEPDAMVSPLTNLATLAVYASESAELYAEAAPFKSRTSMFERQNTGVASRPVVNIASVTKSPPFVSTEPSAAISDDELADDRQFMGPTKTKSSFQRMSCKFENGNPNDCNFREPIPFSEPAPAPAKEKVTPPREPQISSWRRDRSPSRGLATTVAAAATQHSTPPPTQQTQSWHRDQSSAASTVAVKAPEDVSSTDSQQILSWCRDRVHQSQEFEEPVVSSRMSSPFMQRASLFEQKIVNIPLITPAASLSSSAKAPQPAPEFPDIVEVVAQEEEGDTEGVVDVVPVSSPFQERSSMFENVDESAVAAIIATPPLTSESSTESSLSTVATQLSPVANLPACRQTHEAVSIATTKLSSLAPAPGAFKQRSSMFEQNDVGKVGTVSKTAAESAFAQRSSRFEQASSTTAVDEDEKRKYITSGLSARSAAFEATKQDSKAKENVDKSHILAPVLAVRASVFEAQFDGDETEREREEAHANPNSVFLASHGYRSDPNDHVWTSDDSTVHATLSGAADVRKVSVPFVDPRSGDLDAIVRMNEQLVSSLMQLMAACTEIEKSKNALYKRIGELEMLAARDGTRK
jgi:hypothetical protein